jgi:hypothetical protein
MSGAPHGRRPLAVLICTRRSAPSRIRRGDLPRLPSEGHEMIHHELTAKALVEDRHRELRHRAKPRPLPKSPPRRWTRPGRR